MFRILFLCTGNSGRSEMAFLFAKNIAPSGVEIIAASDKTHCIHNIAHQVMSEMNLKLPDKNELKLSDIMTHSFDIVVTLCNKARELCPEFPGSPAKLHWSLIDPTSKSSPEDLLMSFRLVRDEIKKRVDSLFSHGFVNSIREIRLTLGSILNNLTDGVMAHDVDRRIFFLNKAAEKITGYSLEEVIGRDCHDVFPNKFCGGDCSFCEEREFTARKLHYPRVFKRKNGEKRNLEMTVVNLKPPNNMVSGALVVFRDVTEVVHLRKRLENTRGFNGIIGHHPSMTRVYNMIRELADVQVPILIQGETGSGKDMVAGALHQLSNRASGPFVPVNCGALPEGTLESELFGHVKGAFTGAIRDRKGRFELAEGGTIFLDEIGEVSTAMQVKLLRVLQEKCFVPVGGEKTIKMNVRVICATNRDLKLLTQQGLFREDLFYRLSVVPIHLPALRERANDIILLAEHFLDKYSVDIGKRVTDISDDARKLLMKYHWPGNVRELSNAIQYAMIKCDNPNGLIGSTHLPPEIQEIESYISHKKAGRPQKITSEDAIETLERAGGNKAKAAKLLGVSRTTLYRLISEKV
jgi:PAS domain S-box-containing protein